MKKKIIIVDDNHIIRDGVKATFKRNNEFEMVGDFDNEVELFGYLEKDTADIILMDINLRHCSGIVITKMLKSKYPHLKIIMHSMTDEPYLIAESKLNGADGYILKTEGLRALEMAMKQV